MCVTVERHRHVVKFASGFLTGCVVVLLAVALRTIFRKSQEVEDQVPVDKLIQKVFRHDLRNNGSEWKSSEDRTNTTIADRLASNIEILCLVTLSPENDGSQRTAIEDTWGKRCTQLVFVSSAAGVRADVVVDSKPLSWAWTEKLLRLAVEQMDKKFDWVLLAEDNTYVIVENLRYMLHRYSPDHLIHFGHKYKPNVRQGWFCSGAGVVLSRAAIQKFLEASPQTCQRKDFEYGDAALGECMERLGVVAGDTRDSEGRQRFICGTTDDHMFADPDPQDWSNLYEFYVTKKGNPLSNYLISFHYVTAKMMYVYDYMIYQLHPHGVLHLQQTLKIKLSQDQMLATNSIPPNGGPLDESPSHLKHRNQQIFVVFPKWTN